MLHVSLMEGMLVLGMVDFLRFRLDSDFGSDFLRHPPISTSCQLLDVEPVGPRLFPMLPLDVTFLFRHNGWKNQ